MHANALSILNAHGTMCLATVKPDGWPQATTVCYVNDGLEIYFLVSLTSQKFANISGDDRVSIAIGAPADRPADIKGLSMAANVSQARDEPYRSQMLKKLSDRHPNYFDAATFDFAGSALMRAQSRLISVVDFSKGLGHAYQITIGADQIVAYTAARPDDWGLGPHGRQST